MDWWHRQLILIFLVVCRAWRICSIDWQAAKEVLAHSTRSESSSRLINYHFIAFKSKIPNSKIRIRQKMESSENYLKMKFSVKIVEFESNENVNGRRWNERWCSFSCFRPDARSSNICSQFSTILCGGVGASVYKIIDLNDDNSYDWSMKYWFWQVAASLLLGGFDLASVNV